jgi:hypothetical protein
MAHVLFREGGAEGDNDEEEEEGNGNFTMRLQINGANVYARGANVIPMEELEARQDALAYKALVDHAADANFNLVRVWGGGIFLPPAFYDRCDERGLLVWHDLMYGQPWNAQGGTGGTPRADAMQANEITYNVHNLAHHPSIILWNGGNEWCGSLTLWTEFVMPTLIAADASRPIWPTSPSTGFQSGVHRRSGLPNGRPLTAAMNSWNSSIETHGPYLHGSGFKTVNSVPQLVPFPPNMPPSLADDTPCGVHLPASFASEFGCSVFSSFESMSPTLPEDAWAPHSVPMVQRNYACDNIIMEYFGPLPQWNTSVPLDGARTLQAVTYLCMIGQALMMKSDIEVRRGTNTFGTVTWQLNEIWPTGGWGSVEYGTVGWTPGQVLGGRWKPLHHWMEAHLYRSVVTVCGATAKCFVKNDDARVALDAEWSAELVDLVTGDVQALVNRSQVSLPRGAGSMMWFCAATGPSGASSRGLEVAGTSNHAGGAVGDCLSYEQILERSSSLWSHNNGSTRLVQNTLLRVSVTDRLSGAVLDVNDVFLAPLADVIGNYSTSMRQVSLTLEVNTSYSSSSFSSTSSSAILPSVVLSFASEPPPPFSALFVVLTTAAHGRFARNGFLMTPRESPLRVEFLPSPWVPFEHDVFETTTRVTHAGQYL